MQKLKLKKYLKDHGIKHTWLKKKINTELQRDGLKLISNMSLSYWINEISGRTIPAIIKQIISKVLDVEQSELFD